jgi:hypothetical protein
VAAHFFYAVAEGVVTAPEDVMDVVAEDKVVVVAPVVGDVTVPADIIAALEDVMADVDPVAEDIEIAVVENIETVVAVGYVLAAADEVIAAVSAVVEDVAAADATADVAIVAAAEVGPVLNIYAHPRDAEIYAFAYKIVVAVADVTLFVLFVPCAGSRCDSPK